MSSFLIEIEKDTYHHLISITLIVIGCIFIYYFITEHYYHQQKQQQQLLHVKKTDEDGESTDVDNTTGHK